MDNYKNRPPIGSLTMLDHFASMTSRHLAELLYTCATHEKDEERSANAKQAAMKMLGISSFIRRGNYSGDKPQALPIFEAVRSAMEVFNEYGHSTAVILSMQVSAYMRLRDVEHIYVPVLKDVVVAAEASVMGVSPDGGHIQ
jgi:hypothetical protein